MGGSAVRLAIAELGPNQRSHIIEEAPADWADLRSQENYVGYGNGTVVEPRLYQLIRQPKPIADRQFEIEFLDAGVETLAFTFG